MLDATYLTPLCVWSTVAAAGWSKGVSAMAVDQTCPCARDALAGQLPVLGGCAGGQQWHHALLIGVFAMQPCSCYGSGLSHFTQHSMPGAHVGSTAWLVRCLGLQIFAGPEVQDG
jgi:hypothetical protein